ncbi:MAG TPA: serine/threonine-protein kinase [Planctomycetota bacterium]|nr:serine/threonine-protein kinase [Planctomycetota bacterium]
MTTNLEGMLDLLASRYCPRCGTRRPLDETVCPTDGTVLRDLSIATDCGRHSTGLALLTGDTAKTSLSEWLDEHATVTEPHDDFQLAGVVLGGKWRVEQLVGEGSFGAFFLGRHVTLGMQVGIKILRKRFTRNEAGLRLFHNEAMRLSLLHHPGIVQVLDYGEEGDRPYLVMEYLTGTPLHRFFGDKTFTVADGVEVVRQAAEALIAAHKGVGVGEPLVHLDLKPEHIFLEKIQGRWHVKVIDFGIAEIAAAPTDSALDQKTGKPRTRLAGTLPYMAPERWDGAVDPRCDLYSLGIVLYEIVAGRKPFDVWNAEAMRILHRREKPTPPGRHRLTHREPGVKELDAIVLRLLEKEPSRRPQSAEELVDTLERWQKRPRLTRRQRLVRECVVPAAVMVLALGLVWWGPGERISGIPERPIIVGPDRPFRHPVYVLAMGYDEAVLQLGTGEAGREIQLGKVAAEGKVEISLELDQLEGRHKDRDLDAVVRVRGWLGRELASKKFKIRGDDQRPRILKLNDNDPPESDAALQLRKGTKGGAKIRVLTNEPLDRDRCKLNGRGADEPGAEDGISGALFTLGEEEKEARLEVFDLAGNMTEGVWPIAWDSAQAPRLHSLADRWTNQPEYELELAWNEPPGSVQVTTGEITKTFTAEKGADSNWRVTARIDFDANAVGSELEQDVLVTTKPPGVPAGNETVKVRYLRRELRVNRKHGEAEDRPPVLHVVADGADVLDEDLTWRLFVVWDDSQGRGDIWQFEHRGASLQIDAMRHLNDRTGKFFIAVEVTDHFGNRATDTLRLPWGAQAPQIVKFGLADNSHAVIHQKNCGAHRGAMETMAFVYQVDPEANVDRTLLIRGSGDPVGQPISVLDDTEPGRLLVLESTLRTAMREGDNELVFIARDRDTGEKASKSCVLTLEAAPRIHISPEEAQPLAGDTVEVTVRIEEPRRAERVLVNGTEARLHRDGSFVAKVQLLPAGPTLVQAQLFLENGCDIKKDPLSYSRLPARGETFGLQLDSSGSELKLRYCEAQELWYTPLPLATSLVEVEQQAAKLKRQLQRFLTSRKLPAGTRWDLRLATVDELQAIASIEPQQPGDKAWVVQGAPSPSEPALRDIRSYVEMGEGGTYSVREGIATDRIPYRLVLVNLGPLRLALPRHASSYAKASRTNR